MPEGRGVLPLVVGIMVTKAEVKVLAMLVFRVTGDMRELWRVGCDNASKGK